MKVENFVYDTFLRLTSTTCPFGFEDDFMLSMKHLFPDGIQKDEWGNYFHQIGQSRTIFASHIDTVSKDFIPVNHVIEGNIIKTDGKTTLGADDKAGVTVMLWMIQNNVPGLYYFFVGEEVGCIGSGLAAQYGDFKGKYDRIISFDRRDTGSIITFQSSSRCCSETFADALCTELNKSRMNYRSDDGGVYTDSAEFMGLIPECTNVSVGYYKEHSTNEHQDISHLISLADACTKVNWETLPTVRDYTKTEYKSYKSYDYGNYGGTKRSGEVRTSKNSDWRSRDYGFHDDWYDDDSSTNDYSLLNRGSGKKRTRRGGSRGNSSGMITGRKFFDGGEGLIDITDSSFYDTKVSNKETRYDFLLDKFLDGNLTYEELQVIQVQYMDENDSYDKYFYEYLVEQMYEKQMAKF